MIDATRCPHCRSIYPSTDTKCPSCGRAPDDVRQPMRAWADAKSSRIVCGKCGKSLESRTGSGADAVFASVPALQRTALRCQVCGFVTCVSCAAPRGVSAHGTIPICPSCGDVGGPAF